MLLIGRHPPTCPSVNKVEFWKEDNQEDNEASIWLTCDNLTARFLKQKFHCVYMTQNSKSCFIDNPLQEQLTFSMIWPPPTLLLLRVTQLTPQHVELNQNISSIDQLLLLHCAIPRRYPADFTLLTSFSIQLDLHLLTCELELFKLSPPPPPQQGRHSETDVELQLWMMQIWPVK